MRTEARSGGSILVFMLVAVVLVTGLALCVGSIVVSRSTLAGDAVARTQLRNEAFSAAAMTAWAIDADTNGSDALLEPWAAEMRMGDVRVTVSDEKSRLQFQKAGHLAFGFLMTYATGLEGEHAMGQSRMLFNWWETRKTADTNCVLHAEEELLYAPSPDVAAMAGTLPYLTVLGDGKLNINTVPREVFISVVLDTGADIGVAEGLYARVVRSRRRGEWFASLKLEEARKLLRGSGDALSVGEIAVLEKMLPRLCVESGLFRITATAERGGVRRTVQCVYERGTGRILRWLEF